MFLAADGLALSETGNHYQTELKTARVNDFIAIAARGPVLYPGQVICHLFGVQDQSITEQWEHPIEELERRSISRPDLDLLAVTQTVSKCWARILCAIDDAVRDGVHYEPPEGDFVVVSCVSGNISAHGWRAKGAYALEGINVSKPVVLAPASDKVLARVRKILSSACLSPEKHVKKAMRIIADQSDQVNENVTLRRSSRGFTLERLY